MSVRQFEQYLADRFIEWVTPQIRPGFRYQFKSPDTGNAIKLYQAFLGLSGGCAIELDDVHLPVVRCNQVDLIVVIHNETGFTENYISRLRDKVASRDCQFSSCALLIIHNSLLDTLINSAQNVAAIDSIWYPNCLAKKLETFIDQQVEMRELAVCLLKDQLAMIMEEEATVFGFAPLYKSLIAGVLEFSELGLFNDPFILSMKGQPSQIRRRIDENRVLRKHIEFTVENYSDQFENVLKDYGAKFINEHFIESKDWSRLDYQTYLDEAKVNQEQKLELNDVEVDSCNFYQRSKNQTQTGQKDQNLLIEVSPGQAHVVLFLTFTGSGLEKEQFRISHNKVLEKASSISVNRLGKKKFRAMVTLPFDGNTTFVTIELRRDNRAEDYKFRCLLVEERRFYLDDIKNRFRVEPRHGWLTLLMKENRLQVHADRHDVITLDNSIESINCESVGFIDFEQVAGQTEVVQFTLESESHKLRLNIEGPPAEEGITLPLLFDRDRFGKIFTDNYDAQYNRIKNKIIVDNSEISVVGLRSQLIIAEAKMVDENFLFVDTASSLSLNDVQRFSLPLYSAYVRLFEYLIHNKTLLSLVAWGPKFRLIAQAVVDTYESALAAIPRHEVMGPDHKSLMRIGMYKHEGKERITPLHPLVIAYHLDLVAHIEADKISNGSASFETLPLVTRERLVASGLLPFVFNSDAGFSHVVPVKDNTFWLDLVPQKLASHSYVRRLVMDKLAEFTEAYTALFQTASRNALIINAINQGDGTELFLGLLEHFKLRKELAGAIHVNFYDGSLVYNKFDQFSETASYESLKSLFGVNSGEPSAEFDMLVDLVRSRLTYSKFVTPKGNDPLAYAHLAFFSNNAPVDCRPVYIEEALSGVLCDGLIAGEASETKGASYFTAFGLRSVKIREHQPLRLALLIGTLFQPTRQSNAHNLGTGIGLAVGTEFKQLLGRSYDSALWTTIIDPKVTLDFFALQQDVVLIHFSDQYTSAAGYDAITVTKQIDLFKSLVKNEQLIREFNAFNGEWLLKMLTAKPSERKEKNGIIGAYKFVSALLRRSDIAWIPLSVAEMIRVSGNVGLKMSDSEFARHVHGYRRGAISDDVLFVGFRDKKLYLLPLEVKTGVRPDFKYAGMQAKELKRYLTEEVLGPPTLASRLYRGLFIRQVLMQIDKLRLYQVLADNDLTEFIAQREWWLKGDFEISELDSYPTGFVVAHVENDSCFEPSYRLTEANILQVELPYGLLEALISAKSAVELDTLVADFHVPEKYRLGDGIPTLEKPSIFAELDHPSAQASSNDILHSEQTIKIVTQTLMSPEPLKVLFGHDVSSNKPLYWEPTNTAKFMNTNTGIIGTMGTGKTQFTKSVIAQTIQNQSSNVGGASIGMLVFDYKSDYVDDLFINTTRAKKYRLHRLPYNPLSLYGSMPMLPVHTATGFAETMARAFGLGQKQQLRLRKLILDAYDLAGISRSDPSTWFRPAPTIYDIWSIFLNQEKVEEDSLYAALDSLTSYEIFETDPLRVVSLYELIESVTVIELAGYSSQIQNLVVALTLDLFYAQMQKKGKPIVSGDFRQITKMILVDEADNFMSQDFSSLRKILKEGREYGVGMILSTQDITHFKTGENNYSSYVLTWVVHRVSEIKNSDIKAIFNKDDRVEQESLMETIRKLDKHCSVYIDGEKRVAKINDKPFWQLIGNQ